MNHHTLAHVRRATLREAALVPSGTGSRFRLKGRVFGDTTCRFPDGSLIGTSLVVTMHIGQLFITDSGSRYRVTSWE